MYYTIWFIYIIGVWRKYLNNKVNEQVVNTYTSPFSQFFKCQELQLFGLLRILGDDESEGYIRGKDNPFGIPKFSFIVLVWRVPI